MTWPNILNLAVMASLALVSGRARVGRGRSRRERSLNRDAPAMEASGAEKVEGGKGTKKHKRTGGKEREEAQTERQEREGKKHEWKG